MRRVKWMLGAVFVALLFAVPATAADAKFGYVDLQRALNESDAGVKAKEYLQKESQEREVEITAKQEALKELKDELDKKSALWNAETRMAKENEFKEKAGRFQQEYMQVGEELGMKKKNTEAEIIDALTRIIEEVADKEGYDFVFERAVGGLIVVPESGDLTDKVIKAYNKKFKEESK